jgi:multisubunit Na+/H+ antiporter MnhC subunit
MYSFLIVALSGIGLALLAQASCLDLILFMNLVDFSIVLLTFASTFCNEVCLYPKSGLFQSTDVFRPFSLQNDPS